MRLLCALVLSTGAAHADPAAPEPVPAPPVLPALGTKGTGAPGVHDIWASGIVVTPPALADAAPWPHGMVMTPPDPHDANVLELGATTLPKGLRRPPPGWSARLSHGLVSGIGGALELLLPPLL